MVVAPTVASYSANTHIVSPHTPRDREQDEQFDNLPDLLDSTAETLFPDELDRDHTATQFKNAQSRLYRLWEGPPLVANWQRMRVINEDMSDLDLIQSSPALALAFGFSLQELIELGVPLDHPHFAGPRLYESYQNL